MRLDLADSWANNLLRISSLSWNNILKVGSTGCVLVTHRDRKDVKSRLCYATGSWTPLGSSVVQTARLPLCNMYLREWNRLFLNCGKNKREDACKIYQDILFLNSIQYWLIEIIFYFLSNDFKLITLEYSNRYLKKFFK